MSERLDGTVALVTGASSGIGEATARALAAQGATVALVARRKDRLEELAQELESSGAKALVIPSDITEADQARSTIDQVVGDLGRLDTLVNNAGVMLLGPAADAPLEEWDRMVALNVGALLHMTHAAIPHLLKAADDSPRGVSDLVNVSSTAGRIARLGAAVYSFTKFGLSGLSESLRQELGSRHVRVGLVEPGAVRTELVDHLREEIRRSSEERFAHIERLEPEDIADAITYMVTRPRRVAVNEMLVRPTNQEW